MNAIVGTVFTIFMLAITLPFLILVVVLIIKGRKQTWEGVITQKFDNSKREDHKIQRYYSVEIRLTDGKLVKIAVDSQRFSEWKVGDRLKKEKGQNWPIKIV